MIATISGRRNMTSAYYSTVLDHPLETVWSLIRDFNNYPAYIEGVSESAIEDNRRGDEVGAIRRFCYRGNWVRQRLAAHSDDAHLLTYAGIEPLPFPSAGTTAAVSPTAYEGTMQLTRIVEGNRTFIEWSGAGSPANSGVCATVDRTTAARRTTFAPEIARRTITQWP
jgi:hypothetical protein